MTYEIRDGSVKTLWRVSLPLILSFLSHLGMITIDRLFLAGYSTEALGAAASAGTFAWALTFGCQSLVNIAGVFVARHNGAGRLKKIGQPVWQMIWLSLFFCIPFATAGLWLAPWIFSGSPISEDQILFYRLTMAISPLTCISAALTGFFAGRGQTKVITYLTVLANAINLVIDPILIFGWGPIPSLGITGACIATGIGMATQTLILLLLFLKRESRHTYGTGDYRIRPKILWNCIRVGGPESLGAMLELGAWGSLYIILGNLSSSHLLVASVGQSILMAFFWFGIGIEHGIASVAGNLLGRGSMTEVRKALFSGLKITSLFAVALFILLISCQEWIIDLFINNPEGGQGKETLQTLSAEELSQVRTYLLQSMLVLAAYISIENIRCLFYGILRAAGDTLFILFLSITSPWVLLLLPTYQLMRVWKMPMAVFFWIWLGYAVITTGICTFRFAFGNWNKGALFGEATEPL